MRGVRHHLSDQRGRDRAKLKGSWHLFQQGSAKPYNSLFNSINTALQDLDGMENQRCLRACPVLSHSATCQTHVVSSNTDDRLHGAASGSGPGPPLRLIRIPRAHLLENLRRLLVWRWICTVQSTRKSLPQELLYDQRGSRLNGYHREAENRTREESAPDFNFFW